MRAGSEDARALSAAGRGGELMAAVTPDMCRVTIVTPSRWADLALPADEPLAEMLPSLLDHVGDVDLEVDQIVLQRLGRPPLDEERSLAANGVVDGETLYLNPQEAAMPEAKFDDLIEGIATGMTKLDHRWRSVHTRRMLLVLALAPVALAWVGLTLRPAEPWITAATTSGVSLLLLVAAAVASRAWDDWALAVIAGGLAVVFGAACGAFVVEAMVRVPLISTPPLLAALTSAFCVASVADVAIGGITVGFAGVAFGCGLGALGSLVALLAHWNSRQGLALTLVLAVVVGEIMVTGAVRLAGVVLPPLPRSPSELEEDLEPVPGQDVLATALRVDAYLTALLWGSSAVIVACASALIWRGGWSSVLVVVAGVASLLRLRVMPSRGQRAAVVTAGVAGPVSLGLQLTLQANELSRVTMPLVCLSVAGLLVLLARVLPGRRMIPHFGRAAELLEGLVAASLVPLLLAVLGTYQAARNLR
jgi:type VII secretion integral membrane protein EccD